MLRYVSVVWSKDTESDRDAGIIKRRLLATDPSWRAVIERSGLMVFCIVPSTETENAIQLSDQHESVK